MVKEDPIQQKSKKLALKIIKLTQSLVKEKEFIISKQIFRSGTSIGANIAEAKGAESRADFMHKLRIAYKESLETKYWLELLYEADFIEKKAFDIHYQETDILAAILFKSIQTANPKR